MNDPMNQGGGESPPHDYIGDQERLMRASLELFNLMRPLGQEVILLPAEEPKRTVIESRAFAHGGEVWVQVWGEERPVNIKRVKGMHTL